MIGVGLKATTRGGGNFAEIPRFWQQVIEAGQIERIPDRAISPTVPGICMDFAPHGGFA